MMSEIGVRHTFFVRWLVCPCYAYSFAVAKLPPGIYIFFIILGKYDEREKNKGEKRRKKVKKGEKREKKSIMD